MGATCYIILWLQWEVTPLLLYLYEYLNDSRYMKGAILIRTMLSVACVSARPRPLN